MPGSASRVAAAQQAFKDAQAKVLVARSVKGMDDARKEVDAAMAALAKIECKVDAP